MKTHHEELGFKVLLHARLLAAKYGWRDDRPLPLGKDPEDIVFAVFEDFVRGKRNFNPKYSVEIQLKRAVQSELWALHRKAEAHAVPLIEGVDNKLYADIGPGPDEAAMAQHDWEALFRLFLNHPVVKGDQELQRVLTAVENGAERAEEIAQSSGIRIERVYELTRKLRKIYPKVMVAFNKMAGLAL